MTIDWPKVAGRMRADLDRAALNERPRMVLAVLIKVTVLKRRTMVVLPDRDGLCGLLGIAKQHMGGVWREIETARIGNFRKAELGWEVVLQPDSSQWACDWVCTREQLDQWVQQVEQMPGQAQGSLLPPEPNLHQALGESGAENVSNLKCYQPVTKSVTADPPAGKSTPLKALKAFKVQGSKPCTKLSDFEPLSEDGLMARCRELFGEQIMAAYGANWRIRARQNPGKLDRVLNDTLAAKKEGRIKTIPAAYANDAWGRFQ